MSVLVTGGTGLVGAALKSIIKGPAFFASSSSHDLRKLEDTQKLFNEIRPTKVIHLAGMVGGVKANTDYVAEFFTNNIYINTNVLHCAHLHKVDKLVAVLSTCIYPDNVEYPITEDQLHNGKPHESNFGYANAKRMLDVQARAYRQQYGCNFITATPTNIFGENDSYHPENSHVIPAIMKKIYEAKQNNQDVELWGSGKPRRQFTYSHDIAKILIFLMREYDDSESVNIGDTTEHSIKEIADLIADIVGFTGNIIWKTDMPEGQYRKPCDMKKLSNLGWNEFTEISQALNTTYKWFEKNYPNLRGLNHEQY